MLIAGIRESAEISGLHVVGVFCNDRTELAGMVDHLSSLWLCVVPPAHAPATKPLNEETIV
jgi:hypothetical protein